MRVLLSPNALIAVLVIGLLCFRSNAYVENPNFCIVTQPLLLSEIEKPLIKPQSQEEVCPITARLLTTKEKDSFIDTMCKDHSGTLRDNYHFFKLHNGELSGRGTYHDICRNNATSVLAWIPYKTILENYAAELNPKERLSYIAKATNVERERTELCHFRHTDLVNNISDNLFTCIVMIFEDNFYGLEDNINALVEIQPLMYQLRNINYMPWRNVTNSYKTRLGNGVLKNHNVERKPIYSSINYEFVEKLRVNTSSILSENLSNLPLLFEHRGSVVELNSDGVGGMNVQEKAFYGRTMDGESEVQVQVIGQWTDQQREFSADIYEYYGHGISHIKQKLKSGQVTFVRIDSTEPVFEAPESGNVAKASLFKEPSTSARLTLNGTNSTEWEDDDEEWDNQSSGNPYPSFYPWFVISCLVLAAVVVFALYGVVRSYSKRDTNRQKYELANKSPQNNVEC
ncbi:uncharacterized protein LOC115634351 [Scaptodrosophila lebanonensis]|uniref:Uncharacterized protein LOC115634351 n=1 Tax=Drosophila lebanonensis TaxID=7225 RepID=A0A6J2UHT1_DROLE|nr:uncharacterized protein LOC115634351 [Scaptodrosophila lebanonensis]